MQAIHIHIHIPLSTNILTLSLIHTMASDESSSHASDSSTMPDGLAVLLTMLETENHMGPVFKAMFDVWHATTCWLVRCRP
jgi:hypothetical protein